MSIRSSNTLDYSILFVIRYHIAGTIQRTIPDKFVIWLTVYPTIQFICTSDCDDVHQTMREKT